MNYKPYTNVRDFMQDILANIDMSRQILIFAQHQDIPEVKAQIFKKILQKNLQYLIPANCSQIDSIVSMSFTNFDPLFIGQVKDFFFLAVNIQSFSCHPVVVCIFFNEDDVPVYTVPTIGNTFNPISQKPYGLDEMDDDVCKSMTGKSLKEFVAGTKAEMDKIVSDLKSSFHLPEHSALIKHSVDINVSGVFEFALKNKKKL